MAKASATRLNLSRPRAPWREAIVGRCVSNTHTHTHSPLAEPGAWGGCACLGGEGCAWIGEGVLLGNCCSGSHSGSGGIARQFAVPALITLNSSLPLG